MYTMTILLLKVTIFTWFILLLSSFNQVEQQDSILTQLQNELRAERDRHQETGRHLQNARHTNSDLEDTLETNQKEIKELSNKVSASLTLVQYSDNFFT